MADLGAKSPQQTAEAEILEFLDGVYASVLGQARNDQLGAYTAEAAVRERILELEGDGKTRKGKIRELQELQGRIVVFVARARQLQQNAAAPTVPGA